MVIDRLTIGQFARVSWLSVKALRLYDELGLLHPAEVDPVTNYRYYQADQARIARAIAILRQLDMPLAQIREVVTGADPDKVRSVLDGHRNELAKRIRRDEQLLERVENFIRKGAVMTYDISLTTLEPVDVVSVTIDTTPESISDDANAAYARILDVVRQLGITPAGNPRMVYLAMQDDAWTVEACVPVVAARNVPEDLRIRPFEGGRAARTVHQGPYDELGMAYRELGAWIEQHGLSPSTTQPPFDNYLNDCNELDPSEWLTELIWPVQ